MSTFIIAEAGVNHNGDIALAHRLIDVAAEAGADAVKFQTFRADRLVSTSAPKAVYQTRTSNDGESQFNMIRRLELSPEHHEMLIAHAGLRGISFLSSPFDIASLALLTKRFGLTTIKIPSGEITNAPFILEIARRAQRVILSTGMSTLGEVEAALGVLAFGFTEPAAARPSRAAFERVFASAEGQASLVGRVTLLHCTTEYPAPCSDVNLRAMDVLSAAFSLPVGYSDHTAGIHVAVAAVARGACMLEKHFTTDRSLPGPDHAASLEPAELNELVRQTRDIERALGKPLKQPVISEWSNRDTARKSLVAARDIASGEQFTDENVDIKRPGTGVSPFGYWEILGRKSSRTYLADEMLND